MRFPSLLRLQRRLDAVDGPRVGATRWDIRSRRADLAGGSWPRAMAMDQRDHVARDIGLCNVGRPSAPLARASGDRRCVRRNHRQCLSGFPLRTRSDSLAGRCALRPLRVPARSASVIVRIASGRSLLVRSMAALSVLVLATGWTLRCVATQFALRDAAWLAPQEWAAQDDHRVGVELGRRDGGSKAIHRDEEGGHGAIRARPPGISALDTPVAGARRRAAMTEACASSPGRGREVSDRILALSSILRPHQWLKNLLLCAPALAAHRFDWSTGRSLAGGVREPVSRGLWQLRAERPPGSRCRSEAPHRGGRVRRSTDLDEG